MGVDDLLQQFHQNQSMWIARLASSEVSPRSHDRIFDSGETTAMRPGRSGVIMLPFEGNSDEIANDHDLALTWLGQHRVSDVLVWGMLPDPGIDLALLAQGYRVGFEPWWMTRDLTLPIAPPAHEITVATRADIDDLLASDVPYVVRDQLESTALLLADGSHNVTLLIARIDGQVVGQSIVNITGDHAGLFNVGVSGRYRHRGIGTSLSLAAMRVAHELGATTMNLNSTSMGKTIYERAGFRQIGAGQTWIRNGPGVRLAPHPDEQAIAIAIGTGDIDAIRGRTLPIRLPNGMTAQELAARFGRQDSLYHLIESGQHPEIMALWESGLREEAMAAARNPVAREMVSGPQRARPIHHAIERGAGSLVIALIEAGADLTARDGEYRATPLDWAHATNKPTIARIIRQAGGK